MRERKEGRRGLECHSVLFRNRPRSVFRFRRSTPDLCPLADWMSGNCRCVCPLARFRRQYRVTLLAIQEHSERCQSMAFE